MNSKKILISTNLTSKKYGLKRYEFKNYDAMTACIYNYRRLIASLDYDCSLLNDSEVLALEELIDDYESDSEDRSDSLLIEVLNFLT